MPTIPPNDITGLVLAGGRGSRMGGRDKGQQLFRGEPLAQRALRRLAPQVGPLLISANRELAAYQALAEAWQARVVVDTLADFPGPLAGMLAALLVCETPYLACVPCDVPFFPDDLVARLSTAFVNDPGMRCEIATVSAPDPDAPGTLRSHPVFALMRARVAPDLAAYLRTGERRVNAWRSQHSSVEVAFDDVPAPHDASPFYNVNTLQALDDAC